MLISKSDNKYKPISNYISPKIYYLHYSFKNEGLTCQYMIIKNSYILACFFIIKGINNNNYFTDYLTVGYYEISTNRILNIINLENDYLIV